MPKGKWTFLSNHGRVLVFIAKNPKSTEETIAREVGLTARGVQKIITDLESAGYILRHKEGRQNIYTVNPDMPLRHPLESKHTVGEILRALGCPVAEEKEEEDVLISGKNYVPEQIFINFKPDSEGYLAYFH